MNFTKKNVKTWQGFVTEDMHGDEWIKWVWEAVGGGGTWEEGGGLVFSGRKSNLSEFDNTNLPK